MNEEQVLGVLHDTAVSGDRLGVAIDDYDFLQGIDDILDPVRPIGDEPEPDLEPGIQLDVGRPMDPPLAPAQD